MSKEASNNEQISRTWSSNSVMHCLEAAKHEMPETWEKIEQHDLGIKVLPDEEFREHARKLMSFVYKFAQKANLDDYSGLFAAMRLSIIKG